MAVKISKMRHGLCSPCTVNVDEEASFCLAKRRKGGCDMRKTILCAAAFFLLLGIAGRAGAADQPNIFGLAVGNAWTYQGIGNDGRYMAHDEVIARESHMSRMVYVVERRERGEWRETQWLERKAGRINLWGGTAFIDGAAYTMQFSTGLLQGWYPMNVGESKFTAATLTIGELPGYVARASMKVDVADKKQVVLASGAVTAYKLRYRMRIWGNGADKSATYSQWSVPYLGYVQYTDQDSIAVLSSCSINGKKLTQGTERADSGIKDHEKLRTCGIDRQDRDGVF